MNEETLRLRNWLATSTREEKEILFSQMSPKQLEDVQYNWDLFAREKQMLPDIDGSWNILLILAGRMFGKTRAASEMIRKLVCGDEPEQAGQYSRVGLVGINEKSVRDVMVTGKSGLLAVHPEKFRPKYISGQAQLIWPNGAVATMYNSYAEQNLRGPEFDVVWGDEIAAWKNPREVYNQIRLSTRIKPNPIQIYTTTPRPIPLLKEIIARDRTKTVTGSSHENSDNIPVDTLNDLETELGSSRFGKQELHGEILENVEGALWNWEMFIRSRIPDFDKTPCRIVIGVDPSGGKSGDAVGIVVCAKTYESPHKYYVLEDATFQASPHEWGVKVAMLYEKWDADRVCIESNFGGELVEEVLNGINPEIPTKYVKASKGKIVRAEPVSVLYEKQIVFHCDDFKDLEDELTTYTGAHGQKSPNSMDALVWAMMELKGKNRSSKLLESASGFKISGFYD